MRLRSLACATVTIPTLAIVPVSGIDGGFQSAVKLAALLVVTVVLAIAARRCRALALDEALLAAFAVLAVLSTTRLADGAAAIGGAIALFVIVRSSRVVLRDRWDLVEDAVACAATLTAGIAVLELLGVRLPWAELRRPESTIGNRNQLAGYLGIMLPVLIGAVLRRRSYAAPVTVLAVTIVVVTRCRSAYLAMVVALASAAILHATRRGAPVDRRRFVVVGGLVLFGVVLGALPWPGVDFGPSVFDSAGRVLEYETGSGHARLLQHRLAFATLAEHPDAWLFGFGAGSWESATSSHAHDFGGHAPKTWKGALPNSDLLRILVEQGLAGLAILVAIAVLVLRRASEVHAVAFASLVAAGVLAAFDPQLVRPERIALVGVVLGVGSPSTRIVAIPRAAIVAVALLTCALALLRVASYAASSRLGNTRAEHWADRQALAQQLFPRSSLDERRALLLARRDRCDDADAALQRFLAANPRHWGARVEVAQCYARTGGATAARRAWNDALAVEPHVRELLVSDAGNLR